jgi:hypothetical protein
MAYDERQISFTPGVPIAAMKVTANSFVLMGPVLAWAIKL